MPAECVAALSATFLLCSRCCLGRDKVTLSMSIVACSSAPVIVTAWPKQLRSIHAVAGALM